MRVLMISKALVVGHLPAQAGIDRARRASICWRSRRRRGATSAAICRWSASTPTATASKRCRSASMAIFTCIFIAAWARRSGAFSRRSSTSTKNPTTWRRGRRSGWRGAPERSRCSLAGRISSGAIRRPFAWGERWVLDHVDYAIAGTEGAAQVWRAKGYRGDLAVIAQFGVDPDLFAAAADAAGSPVHGRLCGAAWCRKKASICCCGRLAQLDGDWRVRIVGGGPLRAELERWRAISALPSA